MDEEERPGCGDRTALKLHTSKLFLRHYGLQHDTTGSLRLLSPVALHKVVIGARSRQSFKWAGSDKFSNGLLILASCPGQRLLAREGDPLLLPYHPLLGDDLAQVQQYLLDLVVLECTPVQQGTITVNTSLVVTDCRDLEPWSTCLPTGRNLTSVFVSDFAHYANSLGGGNSLLDSKQVLNSSFSGFLQALECRLEVKVVDVSRLTRRGKVLPRGKVAGDMDVDSAVFVSKPLLLKLGLFNREWVQVSRFNSNSDKPKTSSRGESPGQAEDRPVVKSSAPGGVHLASVVVADFGPELELQDNAGFISPTHWFNLTDGEALPAASKTVKIKRWSPPSPQPPPGPPLSESRSRGATPPFARELHVEVVVSPEYSPHGPYDSMLCQHFTTPRLVRQGHVLGVPSQGQPQVLDSNSEGITRWPVVFFKVKKVCGSSKRGEEEEEEEDAGPHLADSIHTSLYMRGSTNSLSPCCVVGDEGYWSSLCPPGLGSTVGHLTSIIQPHINHSCALARGCSVLLLGPSGSGKVTSVRAASQTLHLHLLQVECVTLCADTAAACEVKMRSAFQQADAHRPCVLLLRNLQLLGQSRDGGEEDARVMTSLCHLITNAPDSVVVIGVVRQPRDLSADVMSAFVHQVSVETPGEDQRRAMLAGLGEGLPLGRDVNLGRLAKHTAGFVLGDLRALLTQAGKAAHRRLLQSCFPGGASVEQEEEVCVCGVTILSQDFTTALETLQHTHSQAIGAPKIPRVHWGDVGGLQGVKREVLDTVQLLGLGLRRAGLLLYGPPGTGKTLLAKAVATECSMTFLSVKGPELINMYVGQSEQNVREVFSKARSASPCIIFFDELDSLAPNRGRSGDSGGVMDRVVSQLLAELDGLHSSGDVFVIGATNRPDLLDQSLLRPGRFDKLVYVGINEDRESQLQVLKAIVRKFKVDPCVSLQEVVGRCPPQLTGADMYALCSDAMMSAVKRKITRISDGLDSEETPLLLCVEDFDEALLGLQPSVSDQELLRYKLIQQKLTAK